MRSKSARLLANAWGRVPGRNGNHGGSFLKGTAVGPLRRNQTPPIDLGQAHVPGIVLSVHTYFLGPSLKMLCGGSVTQGAGMDSRAHLLVHGQALLWNLSNDLAPLCLSFSIHKMGALRSHCKGLLAEPILRESAVTVHQCHVAAVTKYHRFGGLEQHK